MPIYEFYCGACNTIFNFFSSTVNTEKRPDCPLCGRKGLERIMSMFSTPKRGKSEEGEDGGFPDIDEAKMEKAMAALASEADKLDEDDPRQAAQMMRKLSDMTGLNMGPAMEEALGRLEAGEDPDLIEQEMGDLLEGDELPFTVEGKKAAKAERTLRKKTSACITCRVLPFQSAKKSHGSIYI